MLEKSAATIKSITKGGASERLIVSCGQQLSSHGVCLTLQG
jgi:hypothetical protein